MNLWLTLAVIAIATIAGLAVRLFRARAARRRRPRVIEEPNSHYTPKLVLDREARNRWHAIPLERVHEINRAEVRSLLTRVDALGVDSLTDRERTFLDSIAELNPPRPRPRTASPSRSDDSFWADPFGFERRFGTGDAKH